MAVNKVKEQIRRMRSGFEYWVDAISEDSLWENSSDAIISNVAESCVEAYQQGRRDEQSKNKEKQVT